MACISKRRWLLSSSVGAGWFSTLHNRELDSFIEVLVRNTIEEGKVQRRYVPRETADVDQ